MKKLLIIGALLSLMTVNPGQASTVDVLSYNYHVWGEWLEWDWPSGELFTLGGNFDVSKTDGTPLSHSVETGLGLAWASTSIDLFHLYLDGYARSLMPYETDSGSLPIDLPPDAPDLIMIGSSLSIYADAIWNLRTESKALKINIDWPFFMGWPGEVGLAMSLTDLNTSTVVLTKSESDDWWGDGPYTFNAPVDPSHDYEFRLYGWGICWDGAGPSMDIKADIIAPESTTILLLGLGLVGLAGVRRGFKN